MRIMNTVQIEQKIKRLAIEILENNLGESELIFAGINNNGMHFAELLAEAFGKISNISHQITRIRLNPAEPLSEDVTLEMDMDETRDKVLIIVDDVANTGRTIFYAIKPLLSNLWKKVEIAVLVDRTHKQFPVKVDYFGQSLATTLQQNIQVDIRGDDKGVYLE